MESQPASPADSPDLLPLLVKVAREARARCVGAEAARAVQFFPIHVLNEKYWASLRPHFQLFEMAVSPLI